ncbi:MAG: hypothetical protein IPP33_13425 [Flavobacteriales bacterium]|nr:hypothetical protein [Flavobacteriales bacterium]
MSSMLSSLFSKTGKNSLDARAAILVSRAQAAAVSSFVPFLDRFPALQEVEVKEWDRTVTMTVVFIATMQLNKLKETTARKEHLMSVVISNLLEWDESSFPALQECKAAFDQECESSTAGLEPRFVLADALGAWVLFKLFGRRASSPTESELGRAIGLLTMQHASEYWQVRA